MKLKSTEKLENGKVCLEIQVEKPEFDDAMEKAYLKNKSKISVPGFRKGKAPRAMIERMYGAGVFTEDAINIAYPAAFEAAIKESGYEPVDYPEVELVDINDDGFTMKTTVTVKPEVKLGKYKGVEAEKPAVSVTKKDVEAELSVMLERNARLVTVERPAKDGDTVLIDFEGFVDGVAFEGGKSENHSLKLGSNQFIPGFEAQLVDKSAGDDVDVNVTFPKEYHAEDLAGKEAVFKVKIHEVKETELPALDDEFAKDVSEFETLDELKKSIEKKIRETREKMSNDAFEAAIVKAVVSKMKVEIPEVMIEAQLDNISNDFAQRLEMQGIPFDQYLEMMQSNIEDFRKNFRSQAEDQVKSRLALEAISKAEKIEPTDEDVEAEYTKLSEQYGMPVERIRSFISPDAMKSDLYTIKALQFLRENAVATAPVKKTTAKKDAPAKEASAEKKPAAKKTTSKASGETKTTAAKKTTTASKSASTAKKPAAKKTTTKKAEEKE
ncbi:MAG: trigger factor [Oscillospiraceae bacterium]|nr:trigger factor [Oscillospiraceae bacterium]